jgi:hypothetical protein
VYEAQSSFSSQVFTAFLERKLPVAKPVHDPSDQDIRMVWLQPMVQLGTCSLLFDNRLNLIYFPDFIFYNAPHWYSISIIFPDNGSTDIQWTAPTKHVDSIPFPIAKIIK